MGRGKGKKKGKDKQQKPEEEESPVDIINNDNTLVEPTSSESLAASQGEEREQPDKEREGSSTGAGTTTSKENVAEVEGGEKPQSFNAQTPDLKLKTDREAAHQAVLEESLGGSVASSSAALGRSFSSVNSFSSPTTDLVANLNDVNQIMSPADGLDTPNLANYAAGGREAVSSTLNQIEKVEKRENIRLLEQIPLLRNLHKWEKSKIAEHLQFRDYDEGGVIVLEGDEADEFYIVKDGVVDISVDAGEGKRKILSTITRRGWFGELALLKDQPRNATAIARTKVQCLVLVKDDFIRLIGTLEEVLNRGNVVARHKKAIERWHRAFNIVSKTLLLLRRIRKEQERKLDWKTLRFGGSKLEKAYQVYNKKETNSLGRSASLFAFGILLAFFIHDLTSDECRWNQNMIWLAVQFISLPFVLILSILPDLVSSSSQRNFVVYVGTAFLWVVLFLPWIVSNKEATDLGYLSFLVRVILLLNFIFHFAPLSIVRTSTTVLAIVVVSEVFLLNPRMLEQKYEVDRVWYESDSTMSLVNMQAILFMSLISCFADHRRKEMDHRKAFILAYDIHEEWKSSEAFLHSMLPNKAITALKKGQKLFAEWIENGTVVFIQICDFNRFVENMPPRKLINFLNEIFLQFDSLVDKHRVYKIETVNEYYMAGSGILKNDKYHAINSAACAVAMLRVCEVLSQKLEGEAVSIKIGLNSGSLIAGVIGLKQINYRVFGDTVNIASRMCSNSKPGKIMLTKRTAGYLKKSRSYTFDLDDLGEIPVKGKGKMQAYYLKDAQLVSPLSPSYSGKSDRSAVDYTRSGGSFNGSTDNFKQGSDERISEIENAVIDISETNSFKSFSRKLLKRVSTRRLSRLSLSEFRPRLGEKRKSLIKEQIDKSVMSHGTDYKAEPSEPSTPTTPHSVADSSAGSFAMSVGGSDQVSMTSQGSGDTQVRRDSLDSTQSLQGEEIEDEDAGRIQLDADNLHSNLTKPPPMSQRRKSKRKSLVEGLTNLFPTDKQGGGKTKDPRRTKTIHKRKSDARRKSFIEKLYPEMDLSLNSINAYQPKEGVKLKASMNRDISSRIPQFNNKKRERKGSIVHDMWKKNANLSKTTEVDKVQINFLTLKFEGKNVTEIEDLYQHRKLYELKRQQSSAVMGISAVLVLKMMMELQYRDVSKSDTKEYLACSLLTKAFYIYLISMVFQHNELKVFRELRMRKNEFLVIGLVTCAALMLFVPTFVHPSPTILSDAIICIYLTHYSFHACIFQVRAMVVLVCLLVLPGMIIMGISAGTSLRFKVVECSTSILLIVLHTGMLFYSIHCEEFLRRKQYIMRRDLLAQNKVFELLIYNLVPPQIVYKLRRGQTYLVTQHPDASVLFADIKGFTPLTASVPAIVLVGFLNTLFSALDDLCIKEKVYKVNTIGDCYVVAAGVPTRIPYHAEATMEFARKMLCTIVVVREDVSQFRPEFKDISMRIGIHSGPVTSGVVGKKSIRYEIWGKTVEKANSMESSGVPMRIHCSQDTQTFLRYSYNFEYRAKLGTYLLIDSEEAQKTGIEKSRRTLELLLT